MAVRLAAEIPRKLEVTVELRGCGECLSDQLDI